MTWRQKIDSYTRSYQSADEVLLDQSCGYSLNSRSLDLGGQAAEPLSRFSSEP